MNDNDKVTAQKDYACVLGIRLEELIKLNKDIDVNIEYITILQALSDSGLRLTYVGSKRDIAGLALVDAICNDYEVPTRQPHQANIFTMWIGKMLSVDEDTALEIHNFIDKHTLINWGEMNAVEWTEDMDIKFNIAVDIAFNSMRER
jgi:hypothetical protein